MWSQRTWCFLYLRADPWDKRARNEETPTCVCLLLTWAHKYRLGAEARPSENCVGIFNGVWFTGQSSFSLTMWNNGIMTCSSCIVRLKKTLNNCLQDGLWLGKVHTCPNLRLLSQPPFSNIKAIAIQQQRLPARQVPPCQISDTSLLNGQRQKPKSKQEENKQKPSKTF